MMHMMGIIDLSVSFSRKKIIKCFSQSFTSGEIVTIIGPNGSGKSTVLRAATQLIRKDTGTVILDGKDIEHLRPKAIARQMAILMQSNDCPASFTVRQLVTFGRIPHQKWYEATDKDETEKVDWALSAAGLLHMQDRTVLSLSGGERQRVWIATALAQEPRILLLDEPTTYLDICHQLEIMNLIVRLNREHALSVVMVLHDLNQAAQFSHKIIAIKDGEVYACGKPEDIITETLLQEVYGVKAQVSHNEATQSVCVIPVALVDRADGHEQDRHVQQREDRRHAV